MDPQKIGEYELSETPLAEDAFGKLYVGNHSQSGEVVYIRLSRTPRAALLEKPLYGGLIFASEEISDTSGYYQVAPAPEGELLQWMWPDLRSRGLLGCYLILNIVLETARAIEQLHKQWLIHGQINPAAILVRPGYPVQAYVLCMQPFQQQRPYDLLKAIDYLEYIPQEQLRGAGEPSTDIFALGMLLYNSFSENPPYAAQEPRQMAEAILWGDLEPFRFQFETLSEDLLAELAADVETLGMVIAKATSRNPRERYGTMQELTQILAQLVRRFDPVEVGARLAMQGKYQQAIDALGNPADHPDPARAFLLLGQLYGFGLNEPDKGIIAFRKALNYKPDLETAILGRAHLYAQQKRFKLAKHEVMTLIEREPANLGYMLAYAEILVQAGETEPALNVLYRIQSENPFYLPAYQMAIQIRIDQNELRKAELECNRALDVVSRVVRTGNLDPLQVAELYYQRAVIHRLPKRNERAGVWLNKALEQAPDHAASHSMLADLYNEMGQPELGLQHLVESLGLAENVDKILQKLEQLFKSRPDNE